MTELLPELQAQWKENTKRDMAYVQVSPQCQDVAAVPNQFLQNCEGVCITGLWDLAKSFIYRTCVVTTDNCEDIAAADEADPTATYHCSTEPKGNNKRYLVEGVEPPPSDVTTQAPPPPAPYQYQEPTGDWLSCYECSSLYDKDGQCDDPF